MEALEGLGYELHSLRERGKPPTLEVVVDRDEPISLEDIVRVSETLDAILDELDPFESPYTLDVSSLGAEKPLKLERLPRYVGRKALIHLSHPYQGENELLGTIREVDDETLTLEILEKGKRKLLRLRREDIDRARLAV